MLFACFFTSNFFVVPVFASPPHGTTNSTTDIGETSAKLWGYVSTDGGKNITTWFQYGTDIFYGDTTEEDYGESFYKEETDFYSIGDVLNIGSESVMHDGDFNTYGGYCGDSEREGEFYENYTGIDNESMKIVFNIKLYTNSGGHAKFFVYNYTSSTWDEKHHQNTGYWVTTSITIENVEDYIDETDSNKIRTKVWLYIPGVWEYCAHYAENTLLIYKGYSTGDIFNKTLSGLSPSTTYHYRAVFSNEDGGSYGADMTFRTMPPDNVTNTTWSLSATNDFTLNWSKGNYSDYTLIRRDAGAYPATITDGTQVYNGTGNGTIDTGLSEAYLYTFWAYNSTYNSYSSPVYLNWTASWINCYNETDGTNVTCWDIEISNADGSQVYYTNCTNNSLIINISSLPSGDDVVFYFSAEGYESRLYVMDVEDVVNLDAYLPPIEYEGDEATEYLLHILDDFDNPIDEAKVEIRRYVDGEYESVLSELTDGNGDVTVYLITDAHYKIVISKTDYTTATADYVPTAEVRTKTFILSIPDTEPQDEDIPQEHINFTGEFGGGTLYVNFSCDLSTVIGTTLYVYETDVSTGSETLFNTSSTTSTDSWNNIITGINTNNSYRVVVVYNHSLWGSQTIFLIVNPIYSPPITQDETDTLFDLNYGGNPFGWSNFFLWIFMAMVFTKADKENAGFILMMFGVLCMFISYIIGFNTVMSTIAGGVLPMVMIVVGALSIWVSRRY